MNEPDAQFQKHHSHTHHRVPPTALQNSHHLFLLQDESADFPEATLRRASTLLPSLQLHFRYNHLQTLLHDSITLKFGSLHDEENICLQVPPLVFRDATSK